MCANNLPRAALDSGAAGIRTRDLLLIASPSPYCYITEQGGICQGDGGFVLVTEFRGMTLNGLFCADVLRPLNLVPLAYFTYKYHLEL